MFIFLGMVLVSLAVMSLIRFDTPDAVSAKASDFNMPTVSNSDEIVVVFGTVKLESPNVINWGNFRSEKLTKKVKTGLFSSKRVTTGYKYYCTMDMALCLGDISIGKIEAATYTIAEGPGLTKSISVNLPSLFGQEGGEHQSGIVGRFSVYTGVDNPDYFFSDTKSIYKTVGQSAEEVYSPLYPIQDLPDEVDFPTNSNRRPGNPGVARVIFDGYIGNTTFARPFKFTVTRQPTNVVSGIGIGKDANPAAVIYEILTSKIAGLGLSNDQIDITSLQEAADTLQAEELGISLKWSSDMEASKLIDVICEHINATYYNDNETGKFTLKLVRKADNYDDVPVFNEADILDVVSISRPDTSEIVTEVKVKYISREQEFKEAVAVANSKAAEDYAGRTISQTQTFHGISNARNAQLVAARRLSEYSASPATIEFRALSAKGINNGELAAIEYPLRGITKIVGRVIQIDHGTLEKPIKTIKLLEDIFTTTEGQFSDVPPVQWDGNSSNVIPAPITDYIYLRLNQLIADNPSLILISQPAENANSLTIEQVSDLGNDTVGTQDFYEYRQINTDIKRGTKTLTFAGQFFTATQASSADIKQASNLAVITDGTDYEWIALRTFVFDAETGITTWSDVERGLLDTPPKEWPANTTVYLLGELNVIEPDQSEGDPVLRVYSEGAYRRSDSYAEDTVADNGIHTRPLPPEIDINGKYYPTDITGDTELNVSLLPRDGSTIALNQEIQSAPGGASYTRELYIDGILVDSGSDEAKSWSLSKIVELNSYTPFSDITIKAKGTQNEADSLETTAIITTWDDNGELLATRMPITITNNGAETGDITGWNLEIGNARAKNNSEALNPSTLYGEYCFFAGEDNALSILSQRIDLTEQLDMTADELMTKQFFVYLSWFDSNYDGSDAVNLGIRAYDDLSVNIDEQHGSTRIPSPSEWTLRNEVFFLSEGATELDILQRFTRLSGSNNNACVDDIKMQIAIVDGYKELTIVNPDASDGTTGWTVETGSLIADTEESIDGTSSFWPGATSSATVSQPIAIDSLNTAYIDAGKVKLLMQWDQSGWTGDTTGVDADSAGLQVRYLDGSGEIISTESSAIRTSNFLWEKRLYQCESMPIGTRNIELIMQFVRYSGTNLNAHIDNIKLYSKTEA